MKKIAVFMQMEDDLRNKIIDTSNRYGYFVDFYRKESDYQRNEDVEIILGNSADLIEKSKNLKWMALYFAGVSPVILNKIPNDCLLTNSSGAYGTAIAEHMVMQTLMLVRKMPVFFESAMKHRWHKPVLQASIKDARVTVLGAGDIGTNYAKRIRGFEPKQIIAVNRSGVSREEVYDKVYPISKLDEVFPETDILAMSLPGTPETENVIDAHALSLLPEGAYIINVGRGNSIDEDALMEALNSNHLAFAALDVFKEEPLPEDSPLWNTKNLIITPHVAGNQTVEYTRRKIVDMFCENLENFANNKPLQYTVNRKLGY
jgi:phosphoglycerate dehydrogenase-like enzyme